MVFKATLPNISSQGLVGHSHGAVITVVKTFESSVKWIYSQAGSLGLDW